MAGGSDNSASTDFATVGGGGLNQKLTAALKQKDAENTELKGRLAQLEKIVDRLAGNQE